MANKPKNETEKADDQLDAGPVEDFSGKGTFDPMNTGDSVPNAEDLSGEDYAEDEEDAEGEAEADEDDAKSSKAKAKVSAEQAKMTKMIGVKPADVTAYNPETHRLVTAQGGKYQMKGDQLLHLMGPKPASLIKAEEAGEA